MHGGSHGNEQCDASCQKIILDHAMAVVAADFYRRVIDKTTGFKAADYETPQLFIDAANAFKESALWLAENRKSLSADEWSAVMANSDENCYRATYLINWAKSPETITVEMAAAWTAKLLEWIQADQDLFVPLLKKLADGGSKRKSAIKSRKAAPHK